MSPLRHITPFVLVALLWSCGLSAQHLELSLNRDTIGYGDNVVVTITGEVSDFTSPAELYEPDGLSIVSKYTDYSYNGNNGKVNLTQTFTLQPYSTGTFTIGPAHIQSGSRRIFSNSATVTVTGGGKQSARDDVFLRCDVDKKKVMIGEQVIVYVRLYSRSNNVSTGVEWPKAKAFNGFWYVAGPYDEYYPDTTINLNGISYHVKTLRKEFLFPNATGTLNVPSFHYECMVSHLDYATNDPWVDSQNSYDLPVGLDSKEVPLEVTPFPTDNKPATFLGDAGKYTMHASIDRVALKAWEAATVYVTITGYGNVSFLQLPKQDFPAGIKGYPATSHDTVVTDGGGVSGSKTFELTLIPEKEGKYEIPGITFTYYDVRKKEYVTLTSKSFTLDVAPGPPPEAETENNLEGEDEEGAGGMALTISLIVLVPAAGIAGFLIYRKRKKKKAAAEEIAPEVPQEIIEPPKPRVADAVLPHAERLLHAGQPMAAVSALYEGFLAACCQRGELTREEASVHQLRYRLNIKKIPSETVEEILEHSQLLSRLRYTPSEVTPPRMAEILQKTRVLLTNL